VFAIFLSGFPQGLVVRFWTEFSTGEPVMDTHVNDGKSCGTQLFSPQEPNNEWGPDQLGFYAQSQHQFIIASECLATPAYWRLGRALYFAKKSFGHGQWEKFLEQWGIDKTRAAKARAIFGTFDDEHAVEAISVERAYAQRNRKQASSRIKKTKPKEGQPDLRTWLGGVSGQANLYVDNAAFADQSEAESLLDLVAEAIVRLGAIQSWLQHQAKNVSADGA
jgi:hypothetical protein